MGCVNNSSEDEQQNYAEEGSKTFFIEGFLTVPKEMRARKKKLGLPWYGALDDLPASVRLLYF